MENNTTPQIKQPIIEDLLDRIMKVLNAFQNRRISGRAMSPEQMAAYADPENRFRGTYRARAYRYPYSHMNETDGLLYSFKQHGVDNYFATQARLYKATCQQKNEEMSCEGLREWLGFNPKQQ